MVEMRTTWINDRWPLLLPEHRAARPVWDHWEAGRLASMWHHLWPSTWGPGDPALDDVREHHWWPENMPREVVYDIGSEEGDFPALFSSWGCDVVLFEPNDRVWPNIKAIWEANELRPPLSCFDCFVGVEPRGPHPAGNATAYTAPWPPSADGPVIGDHGFKTIPEYPEINVVTIDEVVSGWGITPPTAITIDVEGAEWLVLVGAKNVMKEHRPKIWVSVHQQFAREMYGDTDVLQSISLMMRERDYDRGTFIAQDHEAHWLWLPNEHPAAVAW